jgi:protein-disulfide isomerase
MIEKRVIQAESGIPPVNLVLLCAACALAGGVLGFLLRGLMPVQEKVVAIPELAEADDPSWGPADAKVTVVEFAEFECPYCRQWYSEVYLRLKQEYAGRIRFVFRDDPLDIHPDAKPSAIAAHCAGEQNKYWEYFDMLFGDPLGVGTDARNAYAQRLMLDMNRFQTCLSSGTYAQEIQDDMFDAGILGVRGVPAFYVNKRMLSGAQPFEVFQQAIDEELAAAD